MALSGIAVDEEVGMLCYEVKWKHTHKYVTFCIENEKKVVVDQMGEENMTEEIDEDKKFFEELKQQLIDLNEPRYVLYDFGFTSEDGMEVTKLAFIFWSPDSTTLKKKMIYASTKDAVQKQFRWVDVVFEAHDKSDLHYEEMAAEIEMIEKKSGRRVKRKVRADKDRMAETEKKAPADKDTRAEIEKKPPGGKDTTAEIEKKPPDRKDTTAEVEKKPPDGKDTTAESEKKPPDGKDMTAEIEKKAPAGNVLFEVLAELQQADLITSEECKELRDPNAVVTVQGSKISDVMAKTADVLRRHGFEKEAKHLEGQILHKFEKCYSEVVRNQASVTLKITKCTTIGPPRIGKTCFKHLLTGEEWDVEAGTASTDVMEAPEWVECYGVEEGGVEELWNLLSPEQQRGGLLRDVNALATNDTHLTTTSSPAIVPGNAPTPTTFVDAAPISASYYATPVSTPNDATPMSTPSDATPTITTPTMSTTARSSLQQALEAIAGSQEKLEDLLKDKEGKVLSKTRLIHFIDTGGQAIYHDVHPVLITSPSIYLVVFSMKELYQKKNDEANLLSYFRSDLIQRPLRSIYTFGTKNPQEEHLLFHPEDPTVFIVGTHLDKIPGDQREEFLEMLHYMISTEIGNKPYREFVQYDPEGRSFWAVDNTQAGKEQDEADREYVSTLRSMVQDRSMEMSVDVPLPWMLLKLVMEGKGVRYCKYSALLQEACNVGYVRERSPSEDLDTMLKLFHILGLMYHKVPRGHRKEDSLVFINPDCLYSATSDFLMAAKEEIEDNQEGIEEGQRQIQAATKEETEDSQDGSEEGQHQTQAATVKESEDSQQGSEESQHQTQAANIEETEDSQGGSEKGQHQTQAATTKRRSHEKLAKVGIRQQKPKRERIVTKNQVIQRMKDNVKSIEQEVEAVLQTVEDTVARIGQKPTEAVLESLHAQLKEIQQRYKLHSGENQDASSVKAKRQLFVGRLVHSLASSVEACAVQCSSERKGEAHVREKMAKAVENIRAHYQSRFIASHDMHHVLSILSDLRIIAQLSNPDSYVVPAALPEVPHLVDKWRAREVDPILVTMMSQTIMQVCYLPSGLFCCLISELVTGLGWTVHPLGRTHVAFAHEGLNGRVHIIEHESYIEIKLESEASLEELTQTCQAVKRSIHESIIIVYENLYSSPTEDTTCEEALVWGVQCEGHPSDETHIAALRNDNLDWCAECLAMGFNALQPVTRAQLVWVSDSS